MAVCSRRNCSPAPIALPRTAQEYIADWIRDAILIRRATAAREETVELSPSAADAIGFIAPIFMKRSILETMLASFGLSEENSFVLEDYGHCQSADAFIALQNGESLGRLKEGDVAVLVAAGTGYTWAATAVKWGAWSA